MKDKKNNKSYVKFVDLYSKYGVLLILVIVFLICSFSSPAFLQWGNILSTLNQAAITMVLTCGMTMLLISGHAWKEHTATTQTWIPNIVVVEDYGPIPEIGRAHV